MSKSNSNVVVVVTEGETDELFYKKLLSILRKKAVGGKFSIDKIDTICITGVARFESKLYRKFRNDAKNYRKNDKDARIVVFLCYDKDVFKGKKNPPVNWQKVEKDLKNNGANEIHHVVADEAIEDFILIDFDNVLKFLKLPAKLSKDKNAYKGVNGLKKLYKKANKGYIKGKKADRLIEALDFDFIEEKLCKQIHPFCKIANINCDKFKKF